MTENIELVEFYIQTGGRGGPNIHYVFHTKKTRVIIEAASNYKKIYKALEKLELNVYVREICIEHSPVGVKTVIEQGVLITTNQNLEKRY